MSATAQYIVLLAVSLVATFGVGQFLIRAGEPFLQEVFHDKRVTRSLNLLLSVLFHLVTLGVLAIISVVDVDAGEPLQTFVFKLGIVLLVLGVAYGISMLVLLRVRAARREADFHEQVTERLAEREQNRLAEQHQQPHPQPAEPARTFPDAAGASDHERV